MTPWLPEHLKAPADVLVIWTVYEKHPDNPEGYILVAMMVEKNGSYRIAPWKWFAPTLDELRKMLPGGLVRLDRRKDDDPTIVETWL